MVMIERNCLWAFTLRQPPRHGCGNLKKPGSFLSAVQRILPGKSPPLFAL